jgi:hypothetical protein
LGIADIQHVVRGDDDHVDGTTFGGERGCLVADGSDPGGDDDDAGVVLSRRAVAAKRWRQANAGLKQGQRFHGTAQVMRAPVTVEFELFFP